MKAIKREQGFTLIELSIAMLLLGIVTIMVAPYFNLLISARKQAYAQDQALTNQKISQALLQYAEQNTALGTLPAPYSSGSFVSSVYDPADVGVTSVQPFLLSAGLNPQQVNTDQGTSKRVRVYQRVTGLTQSVPLYGQSGPAAGLTYQLGVVYMTPCPLDNSAPTCNPNPGTGLPGASVALTSANYRTWTTQGEDLPAVMLSTLPLQKQLLATTRARLDRVRDALSGYFRARMLTAAATDTTNFYPAPTGGGAPVLSGAAPGANQGCRDGWYSLDAANVNVLAQVGLSQAELGATAWGGGVQYCRDYDPTGTSGANVPPHYAALRVLGAVSQGAGPDATPGGTANNIILSF